MQFGAAYWANLKENYQQFLAFSTEEQVGGLLLWTEEGEEGAKQGQAGGIKLVGILCLDLILTK